MRTARARGLGETCRLAREAAIWAGVTRVADVSGLAGMGIPVFQAVRPAARSLTVSQGKGGTRLGARVSALLEACELACAERLPPPIEMAAVADLPAAVQRCWSGERPPLCIDLEPGIARGWVEGRVLGSDASMPMPWDLLSLDFTRTALEYLADSDGLATGNTRDEAILGALCELLEHDLIAGFEALTPAARRMMQVDTATIEDGELVRDLARVRRAGFTPRLWSLGQACGIPAFACKLFAPEPMLDTMSPTGGSGCHPDHATAALAALREAVQGRAALVAGARDDIVPEDYRAGRSRARALLAATLAVAEGPLPWGNVPSPEWRSAADGIALLREAIGRITPLPVVVFDHTPPVEGFHVVHALAPGLRNLARHRLTAPASVRLHPPVSSRRPRRSRAVLFAGPSIAGLTVPQGVELLPPAVCGDLAALLDDPPAAVGLIDGHFGIAPTVWHKEILELLAHGVRVLGAASIGALRAAELEAHGMEGVGAIFAAYRDGAIERDDAVMVLQAPAEFGFAPLTLPLVDAEQVLCALECEPRARRVMQRIVRTMPYETRTWERCLAAYRARTGSDFPLALAVLAAAPSLKRQDTALLIERLAGTAHHPAAPHPRCAPPMTGYYLRMRARTRGDAAPAPW